MSAYFQKKTLGALLLFAGLPHVTKRPIKVAAGLGVLPLGTVLARSTADADVLVVLAPGSTAAGDKIGTCTVSTGPDVVKDVFGPPRPSIPVAVLAEELDTGEEAEDEPLDATGICAHAVLAAGEVVWPDGITNEQKALAITRLDARSIVLVETV